MTSCTCKTWVMNILGIVAFRKHAFLGVFTSICTLISFAGYCWDGNIPILMINGPNPGSSVIHIHNLIGLLRTTNMTNETCCSCLGYDQTAENETGGIAFPTHKTISTEADLAPFIASGPSKVLEIVPMHILREKVSLNDLKGLSYLNHVSLSRYYQCHQSRLLLLPEDSEHRCKERSFLERKTPIVALVSFAGSGNTWVRYLLEQATGIYTGSIYCDSTLKNMFPGENVVSGNVIVVKSHHADTTELPKDVQLVMGKQKYDKVILLVRNPFDALVSEANRRWNARRSVDSHVGLAQEASFMSSKWDWYVEYKGMTWAFLLHTWLSQKEIPVHIVLYEKLVSDLHGELVRMLDFLEFQVSNETLDCVTENSAGKFKRTQHLNFDPFTNENKAAVNRFIRQADPLLVRHGIKYKQR